MFCTQCGLKLDDWVRFCTACGKPTGTAPNSAHEPSPKRLHRILTGKKLAGVCAGYAAYFDMDATLMRLIWVGLLIVPPHIGLIAYLVSWGVLPAEPRS